MPNNRTNWIDAPKSQVSPMYSAKYQMSNFPSITGDTFPIRDIRGGCHLRGVTARRREDRHPLARYGGQYRSPPLLVNPREQAAVDFAREVAELSNPEVQATASPF